MSSGSAQPARGAGTPVERCRVPQVVVLVAAFGVVSLAAHAIGRWFTAIRLPYITGYLATGAVVGSFGLDLIPTSAAADLRFVDELSLGVIAFVAGSELRLADLRGRIRSLAAVSSGIVVIGLAVLGVGVFAATGVLAFGADMTVEARIATAALGGAVLLALSPPSTIAVIKDLRAHGPFTSQVLMTTIVMDVVIIVLFAGAGAVAAALLRGGGFDATVVPVLIIDLAAAVAGGFVLGRALGRVLLRPLPGPLRMALVVGAGWGVFELAGVIDTWTAANLPVEIYIEPLLLCLVTGFVVTNMTGAADQFERLLHDVSPAVYVAFFTLTGLSLKLDVLVAVLPVAVGLFGLRVLALLAGTRVGASLADAPPTFRRRSWMAFVTQAGIALGLAREAVVQFPELGQSFATLIIAVVVLNEIAGPLFLASALRGAGEAGGGADEVRRAVVFGIAQGTYDLADRLDGAGWHVRLADRDEALVVRARDEGRDAVLIDIDTADDIAPAFADGPDAVVVMSDDDVADLAVCRAAVERFGVQRAVARVSTLSLADAFDDAGALVVDHMSAMLGLLEEAVVSPRAAELVLHSDPRRETVQVTVSEEQVVGCELRHLRLHPEVLIVALDRAGHRITPDGFTRLHRGDQLTLIGPPEGIAETVVRIGY